MCCVSWSVLLSVECYTFSVCKPMRMYTVKRILVSPFIGRGCRSILMMTVFVVFLWSMLAWHSLLQATDLTLLTPASERDLDFLRQSRHLSHYIDTATEPLITPQTHACQGAEAVPVVALVCSAARHIEERATIRATWGSRQPTFFFIGRAGAPLDLDEQLVDNYMEAKQHSDLIVGDYVDTYENLTLKVMHMLSWSARHCPQAEFVLKTDDDVFLNPWTLESVVKDNVDAKLIGFMKNNSIPHRDKENKWFLPRWLYPETVIPRYLSGTGYIINGEYLQKIIDAAYQVPLINLEDVFLTYLVAHRKLGLALTHEPRLSPYRPLLSSGCGYWDLGLAHSLTPRQMLSAWSKVRAIAEQYHDGKKPCSNTWFNSVYSILY